MAGDYTLKIEQGATLLLAATWKDSSGTAINLTGYTARLSVRTHHSSDTVLLSLTTANGGITLGGAAGTIAVTATAVQTAAIAAPIVGVYDLELVSSAGAVTRLIEGGAVVTPEVTR